MKIRYKVFIGILILIFLAFEWVIFYSPFGYHSQLQNGIQGVGIFVALLTAIIALSTADRKRRRVKAKIETTYIKIGEEFKSCDFLKKGWLK